MRSAAAILVGILLGAGPAGPLAAGDGSNGLAQGVQAKPLDRPKPRYPLNLLSTGHEGWVVVSYVVKADGSTGDVLIEDSSGPQFEESAVNAVRTWRFEPATFAGKPVEQAFTRVALVFMVDRPSEPSSRFRASYNRIVRLIGENDLATAERQIAELAQAKKVSMGEHAHLALVEATLHEKRGDSARQLLSLLRAGVNDGSSLEPATYTRVLTATFGLQVEQQELKAALDTYAKLDERRGDPPAEVTQLVERIRALAAGSEAIGRKGRIATPEEIAADRAPRLWMHELLRREMGFQDVTGTLQSVEFRCSGHRALDSDLPADKTWKIPDSWGDCAVYVTGAPGTTFTLVELPAAP